MKLTRELFGQSVREKQIGTRVIKCLKYGGVDTLDELSKLSYDDLKEYRSFGDKTIAYINRMLENNGYKLIGYKKKNYLRKVSSKKFKEYFDVVYADYIDMKRENESLKMEIDKLKETIYNLKQIVGGTKKIF